MNVMLVMLAICAVEATVNAVVADDSEIVTLSSVALLRVGVPHLFSVKLDKVIARSVTVPAPMKVEPSQLSTLAAPDEIVKYQAFVDDIVEFVKAMLSPDTGLKFIPSLFVAMWVFTMPRVESAVPTNVIAAPFIAMKEAREPPSSSAM